MAVWYVMVISMITIESFAFHAQRELNWTVFKEVKDRIFMDPMFTSNEKSEIACTVQCAKRPCCVFVTYTSSSRSCRGHPVVFTTSSVSSQSTGTFAYYNHYRKEMKYTYSEVGDSCILIKKVKMSWNEAAESCQILGGHLINLDTPETTQAILQCIQETFQFSEKQFWTGGSDIANEGKWVWSDGTVINTAKGMWIKGEPNNKDGVEDCMSMSINGWNDVPCERERFYICHFTN